jgi:dipeptidyl aminopeptidase/acylaminoacyl peptidase
MSFQSLKGLLTGQLYGQHTVKKQLVLLVLGLSSVLVLAGHLAHAAAPPPLRNDSDPYWSPDARQVAFDLGGLNAALVPAGHGSVMTIEGGMVRGFRPDGTELLVEARGATDLVTPAGGQLGRVNGIAASWSPDGGRIAFLRGDTLYVSDPTGAHEQRLGVVVRPAEDGAGPVWSSDGRELAIANNGGLAVVETDGSSSHIVGPPDAVNPSWSPNGGTLAYERKDGSHWVIWLVDATGQNAHAITTAGYDSRFPQWSPSGTSLAFISDRQHAPGGATPYQYALYVASPTGSAPIKILDDVHPLTPARWSPTGAQIAVAAGQECLRWGIYVVSPSAPKRAHRHTNLCRVTGTPQADVIKGSPYFDIINGLGGNDTLLGNGGNDKLSGNGGNDTIHGGAGNDFIFAGPGNDRVFGGSGNDTIIGGNGVDRIDCGPGNDTVEAAGPRDIIARNCEHIVRT